jgi:AraC-like DNA-binding protein
LFSDKTLKKYDWLHFLPFSIYFSLTIFVWIGSYFDFRFIDFPSDKTDSPFSMLSLTIWLFYAFCQTMMLLNYDPKKNEENKLCRIKLLGWIRVYNLVILFLFSTLFVHHFLISEIDGVDLSCYILLSSVLIFTVGWLYFKPQIFNDSNYSLDSFNFIDGNSQITKTIQNESSLPLIKEISQEKKEEYLLKLNTVFSRKKLFLKKNFVIRDLSDETGISVNNLSNLINSEFNLHFQDFVNLKRIEYFNEKVNDPEWKDLSLEGMAWAAGFKSRSTCFRAFVKHTGKSPSEYFKVVRKNPDKSNLSIQN